jgi:hypothetical protein
MSREDDIREILDQTAKEMARLDSNPRTWLSWIVYLLNNLEQQAAGYSLGHKETYKEMLTALIDAIRNRFRTGSW